MSKLGWWKTIFRFCVFGAATAIASPAQTDCSVAAPCFKTVVNLSGTDGSDPIDQRGVVQGTDGNYYGTAAEGGNTAACFPGGCGTVFKIITTSTLTTLHSFDGKDAHSQPEGWF